MKLILKYFGLVLCTLYATITFAQDSNELSIDSCYVWAERNYPLVKQYSLIQRSKEYSLDNVSKGYLPQVKLGGHATYQSDVTTPTLNDNLPGTVPIFEAISKDQYKIYRPTESFQGL